MVDIFKTTGHFHQMPQISKRDAILHHGLDLMHQKGFEATSVADIAAAADAPKGSFYNHFTSKDDFARQALLAYFVDLKEAFAEEVTRDDHTVFDRLTAYFKRLRAYNKKFGFARGCLLGNMSAESSTMDKETRQLTDRMLQQWRLMLANLIAEGQKKKQLATDLPAPILASMLLDGWQGALLRAKAERTAGALDTFIGTLLPTLLKPRPPQKPRHGR
jgi:TetR/AcrR family transcriptional repressor of nem operon